MPQYEIKHYHYHRLFDETPFTLALFKVFADGSLAAVIRERNDFLEPRAQFSFDYWVHGAALDPQLRAAIERYFPDGRVFQYVAIPGWTWNDNGTYQEMPWQGR
jgi:hypothetical protein